MSTAYLLEELWEDSLENDFSRATGYSQIAITVSDETALSWVHGGGVHPGSAWPPIAAGTPKRRFRQLEMLP